ncbi:MAG: hypothetical protein PHY25_05885, partial [Dehalococcoidales bacterium]|nr:hypothetical protein [Dehalococcoidales bacterium]
SYSRQLAAEVSSPDSALYHMAVFARRRALILEDSSLRSRMTHLLYGQSLILEDPSLALKGDTIFRVRFFAGALNDKRGRSE